MSVKKFVLAAQRLILCPVGDLLAIPCPCLMFQGGPKTPVKPSAQKGAAKTAPPKQAAAAAAVKTPQGKKKKGHKHQQYELIVTINLVSGRIFLPGS